MSTPLPPETGVRIGSGAPTDIPIESTSKVTRLMSQNSDISITKSNKLHVEKIASDLDTSVKPKRRSSSTRDQLHTTPPLPPPLHSPTKETSVFPWDKQENKMKGLQQLSPRVSDDVVKSPLSTPSHPQTFQDLLMSPSSATKRDVRDEIVLSPRENLPSPKRRSAERIAAQQSKKSNPMNDVVKVYKFICTNCFGTPMYVCIYSTKINKQRNKIENKYKLINGEG